jgi:hypothetical protein
MRTQRKSLIRRGSQGLEVFHKNKRIIRKLVFVILWPKSALAQTFSDNLLRICSGVQSFIKHFLVSYSLGALYSFKFQPTVALAILDSGKE